MALIICTTRLRDNQEQTKEHNRHSGPVIIVIIICHHINACLLSADRFNKNAPIIQMLITGNTQRGERGAYLQTEQTESALAVWRRDVLATNYLKPLRQAQTDRQPSIPCRVTALQPSRSLGLSKTHTYCITPSLSEMKFAVSDLFIWERMNDGLTLV